jgi:hypothetical protein
MRIPFHPGAIDWSGENPGMYLRDTADGEFVSLVTFFRVLLSPHGAGHAAFVLADPRGDGADPTRPNLCLTDNRPLAEYLRDGFVRYFGAFRGVTGLANVRFEAARDFVHSGDARSRWVERCKGDGYELELVWDQLGPAFIVELEKAKSSTGAHEMFSLFAESSQASATLNGRRLAGQSFPRDFLGKKSTTAFLAFAETWVKA